MRWRRFWQREQVDHDRLQEMESYELIETDENIARGMTPDEARAAARRKLGNRTLVQEEIYQMNTVHILDRIIRDARYASRTLRHNPMFTSVALLTLAIGIGANTAVFSVVNSVLLKPLPYPKSEELVAVWHDAPGAAGLASVSGGLRLSASMYVTYAGENRTFQSFGVWSSGNATVTGLAEPEQVRVTSISDGILQSLNVQPILGRWLSQADQVPGSTETVMLGYGYWQRRFGGDRSVVGRTIQVESRPRQIVGVMPAQVRFNNIAPDFIAPVRFDRGRLILAGFGFEGIARLKPGVTIAQANADVARMVPIWMNSWTNGPGTNPRVYESWKIAPAVRPLKQDVIGNVANVLWILMGTIGIVMLIACANVANLLLVRAESRQQELAVRAALGAGWGRIVQELLLESMLLGLIGGALGVGVANAGLQFLVAMGPANLPRLNEIALDPRALGFALIVSLLSGILFGLIPAWKYAGAPVATSLRGGGRNASHSRDRNRTRNSFVVAQVALAMVLLVSSGLMIRTFLALRTVEPGFRQPEQLQIMRISIPSSLVPDPERTARIENDILDKLSTIPGVNAVAFSSQMPMEGILPDWDAILTEDKPVLGAEIPPMRLFKTVSPGLFQTAGIRLIAGRDYTWTDLYGRRPVVILSENLAREFWGSATSAIGKRIGRVFGGWSEVIGVVQDVRENGVSEPAPAIVYWPSFGNDPSTKGKAAVARNVTFAVRSNRTGSEGFLTQVRDAVWSVNASLPVASVRTMQDVYDQSMAQTSFTLVMLGIAAAMALVLGIIGIYGVLSYAVSQRRREIGIRLALGAQPRELGRMFVTYALRLTSMGVAVGLIAAMGLAQLMKTLLFGISPIDPLTFATVPFVLVSAGVLASYLPARRASAVDPVEALKAE